MKSRPEQHVWAADLQMTRQSIDLVSLSELEQSFTSILTPIYDPLAGLCCIGEELALLRYDHYLFQVCRVGF